jgi:kumamolisin
VGTVIERLRRRAWLSTVTLCLLLPLPGLVRGGSPGARPSDPAARIDLALTLRLPGEREFGALYDSSSGSPLPAITPLEFGERFGLPLSDIRYVERRLEEAGLHVLARFPQRTELEVSGTVEAIGRLFDVRFADVPDASGTVYRRPSGRPVIPANLTAFVTHVSGLSSLPTKRPRLGLGDVPQCFNANGQRLRVGCLKPGDLAAAYDIRPLWDQGVLGQGETVAIVSFDSFDPQDVAIFDRLAGISGAPRVQKVNVIEGRDVKPGKGRGEVNLDIDMIRSIAPRAQILDFEAPNNQTFATVVDRIVADGRATVVSISWGTCDLEPFNERALDEAAFRRASAMGLWFFAASGDAGAYDCHTEDDDWSDELAVDYPSSSPSVVAVGATRLSITSTGAYAGEAVMEDALVGWGGGGGISPWDPLPEWQAGPGVLNDFSQAHRQVPDVAGPGDFESGLLTVVDGAVSPGNGTSQASPFWAGCAVLLHQSARQAGVQLTADPHPLLYRLAARPQSFPPFHDITVGGNLYYPATPGWDFATGLGSPDLYNLVRDVVAARLQ